MEEPLVTLRDGMGQGKEEKVILRMERNKFALQGKERAINWDQEDSPSSFFLCSLASFLLLLVFCCRREGKK